MRDIGNSPRSPEDRLPAKPITEAVEMRSSRLQYSVCR
jgi:hypothetical protein